MSRKHEVNKLIRELRRKGVHVEPGGSGHWRVTVDGSTVITMASSPGGRYAVNSMKRDLRKYLDIDI